jgi:hypothetical protein
MEYPTSLTDVGMYPPTGKEMQVKADCGGCSTSLKGIYVAAFPIVEGSDAIVSVDQFVNSK